jgi:hypothetical protein
VCAASQLLLRKCGEEPLDEIEPGAARRCEMQVKATMPSQPITNDLRFVRAVAVEDQVHVQICRYFHIDAVQELAELANTPPGARDGASDSRIGLKSFT